MEKYDGSTISQPVLAREVLGAGADQQHMGAVLHHRARGEHRAADAADAGDRAGAQVGAVHHGRVELVRAGVGEDGAVAGVEERAVLQHLDGEACRVERGAAAQQQRLAGLHDGAQRLVVGLGRAGVQRRGADGAGAAVDGNDGRRSHRVFFFPAGARGTGLCLIFGVLAARRCCAPCSQGITAWTTLLAAW